MIIPKTSPVSADELQLVLLQSTRESQKAARESAKHESDQKFDQHRAKAEARITQIEKQIEAAQSDFFSFLGGAVWGALAGFTAGMAAPLAGPIIGVLPTMQGAASFLLHIPSAVGAAGLSGMTLGKATNQAVGLHTANVRNEAYDAELLVAELEAQIAFAEQNEKNAGIEVQAARTLIRDVRKMLTELRRAHRELVDARSGGDFVTSAGHGFGGGALTEAVRAMQQLAGASASDQRTLESAANRLQRESLAGKRESIEERKSNETTRAWLGIAELVAEIAATVGTCGGSALVSAGAKLASAAGATASAFVTDEDARWVNRESEELAARARKIEGEAQSAASDREMYTALAEEAVESLRSSKKLVRAGATMTAKGPTSASDLQLVIAQLAFGEIAGSRIDERNARDQKLELDRAAIEHGKKADAEEAKSELFHQVVTCAVSAVSIAGAGSSIVDDLDGPELLDKIAGGFDFGSAATVLETGEKIARPVGDVADGLYKLGRDDRARELERVAEEISVTSDEAENAAKDAKEVREDARERAQRALELAVSASRGRSFA